MLKTLDEDERLRVVDGDKAEEKVTPGLLMPSSALRFTWQKVALILNTFRLISTCSLFS